MKHWIRAGGVVLALLLAMPAAAQFSPGPLSKAHASLDGPTRCTSCHVAAGGNRKFKCLNCHREIRERLDTNRGLHPSLTAGSRDNCGRCHSEHNGEEFVPTRWDINKEDLDHRKTGYPLEGAHARVLCEKCHRPAINPRRPRTYLGLSRQCGSCHQDEHGGQLGTACERCHTVTRWKDVDRFDHSEAKFRLTGAHQRLACAKCHRSEAVAGAAKPRVRFTGIAFAQCTACHRDPHAGAFSAPCSSCHSDVAWKPARNVTSSFDHSKTKFPLAGKHAGVACEKCHRGAAFHTPVAHALCMDCHRDPHGRQFVARSDGGECGSCHTVESWKPSTFTVQAHARTGYPLRGRHASVACEKCHLPAGPATVYRVKFERCMNCHRDAHAGQFTASHQDRCEQCHTVEQFRPSTFTLAGHGGTRFPLAGSHSAVACMDCHKSGRFRFASTTCTACHLDPHQGQFQERAAGCEACHTVQTWRDVSRFDHSATRFALTGAHRGVTCDQCHRATQLSVGLRRVVFRNTSTACASCHEDIHAGQFSVATGNQGCNVCHDTFKWRPSKFDHEQTAFPLAGAHARVQCGDCHNRWAEVNGKRVLFYKPTPKDCSSCHGPDITQ